MVLVIDNYDSFTYNLVQYLGELGAEVRVMRNDTATLSDVAGAKPDRIVISPGPGRPEQAGITMDVIKQFGSTTPILGVCLGHQAIGAVFGGAVVRAGVPMHGKTSTIEHDGRGVFRGIAGPFVAIATTGVFDSRKPSDQQGLGTLLILDGVVQVFGTIGIILGIAGEKDANLLGENWVPDVKVGAGAAEMTWQF